MPSPTNKFRKFEREHQLAELRHQQEELAVEMEQEAEEEREATQKAEAKRKTEEEHRAEEECKAEAARKAEEVQFAFCSPKSVHAWLYVGSLRCAECHVSKQDVSSLPAESSSLPSSVHLLVQRSCLFDSMLVLDGPCIT